MVFHKNILYLIYLIFWFVYQPDQVASFGFVNQKRKLIYLGSTRERKKGNVLFNDALNTFYLVIWHRTYGKGPLR